MHSGWDWRRGPSRVSVRGNCLDRRATDDVIAEGPKKKGSEERATAGRRLREMKGQ